jgi:hypothetical protein
MSLQILRVLLDLHDLRGKLSDFQSYDRALGTITQRIRANGNLRERDFRGAMDQFQSAHTTRVLRRARQVDRQFAEIARWRPHVPPSEREPAFEAIMIAIDDYGLNSREHLQARDDYSRVLHDYSDELRNQRETFTNAEIKLGRMGQYYRNLYRLNDRAANTYLQLVDHRALVALGDLADSIRTEFLAAYTAFDELRSLCASIQTSIDRTRQSIQRHRRALDRAIELNDRFLNMDLNRAPSRREQQEVRRAG